MELQMCYGKNNKKDFVEGFRRRITQNITQKNPQLREQQHRERERDI